jgi:hypothetical protein
VREGSNAASPVSTLPTATQSFPEVIGCSPDALRGNVHKLTADWKLQGPVLAAAVVRQPAVLGYTIDW